MYYVKKTVKAGATIEIEKTRSARYGKKIPRGENCNKTPLDMQAVNRRNAIKQLTWILNDNFKPQDIHLVLTYDNEHIPADKAQAKKCLEKFLEQMREHYKALGQKFDYIAVTEFDGKRIHHHLVIKYVEMSVVWDIWRNGKARPTCLDGKRDYSKLAEYLVKETDRTFPGGRRVVPKAVDKF